MAEELFNIVKAGKSVVSPLSWFKAGMIGLKLLGIGFIVLTCYRAWFMETKTQKQETKIVVEKGGTVHYEQSQKDSEEKLWYWETYVEYGIDNKWDSSKPNTILGMTIGKRF